MESIPTAQDSEQAYGECLDIPAESGGPRHRQETGPDLQPHESPQNQ
jgi:hypothetical protein